MGAGRERCAPGPAPGSLRPQPPPLLPTCPDLGPAPPPGGWATLAKPRHLRLATPALKPRPSMAPPRPRTLQVSRRWLSAHIMRSVMVPSWYVRRLQVARPSTGRDRYCRRSGRRPAWVTTPQPATSQSVPAATSRSSRCQGRSCTAGPSSALSDSYRRGRKQASGRGPFSGRDCGLEWANLQQEEVVFDGVGPTVWVGHCADHFVQALGGLRLRQGVCAQEHLHLPAGPESGVHIRATSPPHPNLLPRSLPRLAPRPLTRPPGSALRSAPTARTPGSRRTRAGRSPAPTPCRAARGTRPRGRPGSAHEAAPLEVGRWARALQG